MKNIKSFLTEYFQFFVVKFSIYLNRRFRNVTISITVCLCMYVLVKFLFWIVVWPIFGKETVLLAFCS